MRRLTHPRSKLKAMVCATILAAASALAKDGETRSCETKFGGQVVCGDLIIGITLEQYKADLNKRAEEIRAEEAEKHAQLQKLVELTERATSAEKDSLRNQIAAVEAEKRALEAEGKGVADRLTNLQASYDGLVQKLAEANAALQAFTPLISKDAFEQAQAMLSRGDVLGAERQIRRDREYGGQDTRAGGCGRSTSNLPGWRVSRATDRLARRLCPLCSRCKAATEQLAIRGEGRKTSG